MLHLADASGRVVNQGRKAVDVRKPAHGGGAGVPAGGGQYQIRGVRRQLPPRLGHKAGQGLQRDVLKGRGGSVEQFQHPGVAHPHEGRDSGRVKGGVGLVDRGLQINCVKIREEGMQQLTGYLRIGQPGKGGQVDLRHMGRHIQPAIGRRAV